MTSQPVSMQAANIVEWVLPIGFTAAGLLAADTGLWFRTMGESFFMLVRKTVPAWMVCER